MPCTDGGVPYPDETKKRLDKVTDLLCGVCGTLEKDQANFNALLISLGSKGVELNAWWQQHKADDAKKKADELAKAKEQADRKAALAKLTPEERKLLGIR